MLSKRYLKLDIVIKESVSIFYSIHSLFDYDNVYKSMLITTQFRNSRVLISDFP